MRLWKATYKRRCPDGSVKAVYRNVDEAFPLYIQGWDAKAAVSLESVVGGPVNVGAQYATHLQGLLYSLDDLNQSLMMVFRAAYMCFKADPCANEAFFTRQVAELIRDHNVFRAAKLKFRTLVTIAELHPEQSSEILRLFQEVADAVGGNSGVPATQLEIASTRETVAEWRGDEPGGADRG